MKKKRTIIIVLILIAILLFLVIQKINNLVRVAIDNGEIESFIEDDEIVEERNQISISGQITSFNTEVFDTTLWSKIDKILPQNESMVSKGQEILNVSNDSATAKIYATIDGKFIENTDGLKKEFVIYDLNNLGIEAEVDEINVDKLKIGQKVDVVTFASNEHLEGRICYISHIPQNEMLKVRVKLNNSENVKIGYSVNAFILLDEDVDENTPVYDIKNSIPKIGKIVVKDKFSNEMMEFSTPELNYSELEGALSDEEIMMMLEEYMAKKGLTFPNFDMSIEDFTNEFPTDDIEQQEIPSDENDYETNEDNEYTGKDENIEDIGKNEENEENKKDKIDIDEISRYYNDYWYKYWSEYYGIYLGGIE